MHYNRHHFVTHNRFDVFKYTLDSYSVLPVEQVIVYCLLDPQYQPRQQELEDHINALFPDVKKSIYWRRNEYQNQWQEAIEEIEHRVVWFACNEDHVFMAPDLEYVNRARKDIDDYKDHSSVFYSHWSEALRVAKNPNYVTEMGDSKHYAEFKWTLLDSIQMMNKELLHHWWYDFDLQERHVPRSDWGPSTPPLKSSPYLVRVPLKEMCIHYDGYSHVRMDANVAPPLEIPPGYFEGKIKIRYGFGDYVDGWVNLNPLAEQIRGNWGSGTDYRWTMQDIPMFWHRHIYEMDVNPNLDIETSEKLKKARNDYHYARAMASHGPTPWTSPNMPDERWAKYGFIK
jgi:hypothetical protein